MKKLSARVIAFFLCLLLAAATPAAALADTVSDAQTESDTQVETSVEEDGDTVTYTTTSTETVTASDDGTTDDSTDDGTTDDGTTDDSSDGSDSDSGDTDTDSGDTGDTDTDGGDTGDSDSDDDDSDDTEEEEEVTLTKTVYSYKLVISVTTTAASSSNSALKKISVTKPKLTITPTYYYSDGSTVTGTATTKTYGLTVKVHVRNTGWVTATTGSSAYTYSTTAKKVTNGSYIQAIQITPSSALKSAMSTAKLTYVYRTKVKSFGTLGWASPGQTAGTTGNQCAMTGLTLKVISTSAKSSYDSDNRYISAIAVKYKTKTTGASSYSSTKKNGSTSGSAKSTATSIGSLSVSIARSSSSNSFDGSIQYSVRTSTSDSSSNWSSYKSNGSTAGSKNSKIKAIRIKLTGEMAEYYDVYYRVYVKGYGWLGWAKNGEKAGTKNTSYNITAVQVKLVKSGGSAPGTTSYHFVNSSNAKMKMILKAQSFTSSTKYLILVDRSNCKVGIFTGKKNNWTLKYYWDCCVGKASTPTISGSYTTGSKGYSFGESKGYSCYYYTQIYGNYLFHSVLYYPYTNTIKDGTMGQAVSHGCVRLTKAHAKWIYDNIGTNTKVYIY